jgi:hypothetical protein
VHSHAAVGELQKWYKNIGDVALKKAQKVSVVETTLIADMVGQATGSHGTMGGGQGQFYTISPATVTYVSTNKEPFYLACPFQVPGNTEEAAPRACNRKVESFKGKWICNLNHESEAPCARWITRCKIADYSGSTEVTMFDETAKIAFGCNASVAKDMWEGNQNDDASKLFREVLNRPLFQAFTMRIKAQSEIYQDEPSTKFVVQSVEVLNTAKDVQSKLEQLWTAMESRPKDT